MTSPTKQTETDSADRIEEQVRLPQPPARVWRALTDPAELGEWFGARIAGETIAPGSQVKGYLVHPGFQHVLFDVIIEEMVPERRFAWRWHPHAVEGGVDYTTEQRTLVTFTLEPTRDGGTLLRVVETGFGTMPPARRASALLGNTKGWTGQLQKRLPAFLAAHA